MKRSMGILFMLFMYFSFGQSAWALTTRIIVQNNTPSILSVSSQQKGDPLDQKYWQQKVKRILPGKRAEILSFSRTHGIVEGGNYYFDTLLGQGNDQIMLKQRVTGKSTPYYKSVLFYSFMFGKAKLHWQHGEENRFYVGRLSGRSTHIWATAMVKKSTSELQVEDVIYVVNQNPDIQPAGAEGVNVLAYNIYMRPTSIFSNYQEERASSLGALLRGGDIDIIVLSEAFDDDIRGSLWRALKQVYPYKTKVLGSDRAFEQDGGVLIISRWPIVSQDERLFEDICSGTDCMADKGVLYAHIVKQGRNYHVFGTHTDADPDKEDVLVRRKQFTIIRQFINDKNIPPDQPVIIAGDLNVNRTDGPGEYNNMLNILDAVKPKHNGSSFRYSYDPRYNDLAEGGKPKMLDYVLYSRRHRHPTVSFNRVILFRSQKPVVGVLSEPPAQFGWKWKLWFDLSDHFAVYARFIFHTAPDRVRKRAPPSAYP